MRFRAAKSLACDVLVVGGGLAASMAAITAAQLGANVILLCKGRVASSGSSARAGGVIAASFDHTGNAIGRSQEFVETHIKDTVSVGQGLCSEAHVRALAEDAPAGVLELERLGVEFSKTSKGSFYMLKMPGNTHPRGCSVVGGGQALMVKLREQLIAHDVRLIENTPAVSLLADEGHVFGAHAIRLADGEPITIRSGATVLATGGATGLFRNVSGDERNTGDGLILGYEVGALLAHLEFVEFTLIFRVREKVLPMAGLAPFLSRGCALVNGQGDRFMERYYPPAVLERAGRAEMLRAVVQEIAAGRGPVYIECSALSEFAWEEFENTFGSNLQRIRDAGVDYRVEPVEVVPAEHSVLAGLVTDANGGATAKGLWAAGECATGVHGAARLSGNGLAACLVFGRRAGRHAAAFALGSGCMHMQVRDVDKFEACVNTSGDRSATDGLYGLRSEISTIAENCLGVVRDPIRLAEGRDRFSAIRAKINQSPLINTCAALAEITHLATLGELMVSAALSRKESRGLHFRADATMTNESWRKWLVVQKDPVNGEPVWSYRFDLLADPSNGPNDIKTSRRLSCADDRRASHREIRNKPE